MYENIFQMNLLFTILAIPCFFLPTAGGIFDRGFKGFTLEHLFVLLFFASVGLGVIRYAQRSFTDLEQRWQFGKLLSWAIFGVYMAWTALHLALGNYQLHEDLPLHLCNFCAVTLPIVFYTRNNILLQFYFYLVTAATTQAIITPHLDNGFPHYTFIKYWTVHCGLVISMLYAVYVLDFRPTFRGIGIALIGTQVYLAFLWLMNSLLGANFGYIMKKPPVASILDLMGEHYILVSEGVGTVLFLVFWLAFRRTDK
ncbi:MAG: hypothetical protein RI894_1223 [Bacteroidota bacterium]|jgi:hypothetical integral membrane protein (TIGR02206 family)